MTIKEIRYKLQKLNMALRNADLHQFQPKMRALTDFLEENKDCKELTTQLDRNDPRYEGWTINAITKREIDLNLSEEQRASLGFQAINHFIGKGSDEIIGITTLLTSDTHLNSHVRAFYDTFIEPLCDWLGEHLESLENLETEPQSPNEEVEQLITRGDNLLKEAEFDKHGQLTQHFENVETQWISEATHMLEEHVGTESELYKSFHRVGAGAIYPIRSDLVDEYREKRIERFQSETGSRLAYLATLKKIVSKKNSVNHKVDAIPKEDIAKQLSFIKRKKLRDIISRDLYEAQLCMDCSYKSVVSLCGSAVEGILIYKLSQGSRKTKAISEFSKKYPKAKNKSDIFVWTFEQLIEIAKQVKLVDEGLRSNLDSIRNFRNFVHPYREAKSTSSPDKHLATVALGSALHLIGMSK